VRYHGRRERAAKSFYTSTPRGWYGLVSGGTARGANAATRRNRPDRLPPPTGSTAESVLAQPGLDRFALDLHAEQPEPVRRWLRSPIAIRVIGPRYDPDDDTAHGMAGGSLADWFDVVAFVRRITPVHQLALGSTASP
jgi:Erythromycin esterase